MTLIPAELFKQKGKNINHKLDLLINYTDYDTVKEKARQMQLGEVYPSTRSDKKYMIENPFTNKIVHWGQMNYEDWTKHRDNERRKNFRNRNAKWANADPYTPAFLSYYLLW